MKYLRRYLYYAGLCLLLVCSANVASAQIVVGLSAPSLNVGPTIQFNVNLSDRLMSNQSVLSQIVFENVSPSEISVRLLTDYTTGDRCPNGPFRTAAGNPLQYLLCMDAGEQDVTIQLKLDNSLTTTRTITIFIVPTQNVGIRTDTGRSVLNFIVHPPVRLRSKVFLEGPLQ